MITVYSLNNVLFFRGFSKQTKEYEIKRDNFSYVYFANLQVRMKFYITFFFTMVLIIKNY